MWEKEQSWARRGKIAAQRCVGKNRMGRKAGGSGDSLSAVKPDHQRKGGLQPLSPIITCKFTKKTTASVSLENATATCSKETDRALSGNSL